MGGRALGEKKKADQEWANRVVEYYEREGNFSKIKTVHHFELERPKCRTGIYRIISRYEERGTTAFRKQSGKPRTQSTPENLKKLRQLIEQDPTMSLNELSMELGLPKGTICRMKVKDLGLRTLESEQAKNRLLMRRRNAPPKIHQAPPELVEESSQSILSLLEIDKEDNLQVQFPAHGPAKLENVGENLEEEMEAEHVWEDLDEFVEDHVPTSGQEGFCEGGNGREHPQHKIKKCDGDLKERWKNGNSPPISRTCLLCRGKLVKPLKINSEKHRLAAIKETGRWKVLCLESLSMLFGLPSNHPLITVFANNTTTGSEDSNQRKSRCWTGGKLCNRCLQDASNVQFVFWQLQNLEQKLSELQVLIYDRLCSNYDRLPDHLVLGRFIGVEDLKKDLYSLNYDDIVKIIFEEIKWSKDKWPKPCLSTRWTQALKNSEQIAQHFIGSEEKEEGEEQDGEKLEVPAGLDDLDNDAYDESSPTPSPPSGLLQKVEVDPDHIHPHHLVVDDSVQLGDNPVNPEPKTSWKLKVRKHVIQKKWKKKIKMEADLAESDDQLIGDSDKGDEDWALDKCWRKQKVSKLKIRKKRVRKAPAPPRIKTKKVSQRVPCTEDPAECQKTFCSRKLMLDHVEKYHKSKKFACDEAGCSGKFKSEDYLARHRELMHGLLRPKEICEVCGVEVDPQEMREHNFLRHRGNGFHKCDRCSMDFTDFQELENHQQLHREYPFSCVTCHQPFSNWIDLKTHVSNSHLFNGVKCNICGVRKPNQVLLQKHLRIHSRAKLVCPTCGKAFASKKYLKYHEDYVHLNPGQKFKCQFCGKVFMHLKNLKTHRSTKHPDATATGATASQPIRLILNARSGRSLLL